jgi:hypothetical protein
MKHLTDDQLAAWLAGEGNDASGSSDASGSNHECAVHLEQCGQCRSEANQLRDGVSRYRFAVRRAAAEGESSRLSHAPAPARTTALRRLRWAGAGALAVVLLAGGGWLTRPHGSTQVAGNFPISTPKPTDDAPPISDDELLEAVNNDLSRDVPQALAPVSALTLARNQIASGAAGRQQ